MKKVLLTIAVIVFTILFAGGIFIWSIFQKMAVPMEIVQYDPQLTIYLEGGCDSAVLTSKDGTKAIVIDTKMGDGAKQQRNLVKAKDITIINTHFHMDHVGGNNLYTNAVIIAGNYNHDQWNTEIVKTSRYPDTLIKEGEEKIIQLDGEKVHIRNMGLAHSWDDTVVYLENRKILLTGDLVFNKMHPFLPPGGSCKVSPWIKILEDLDKRYDIKVLVPGHGKLSDKKALSEMRDYFVSIGDSIGNPIKQQELKTKYKDYFSIPGMLSFNSTLHFIEKERKQK